MNLDLISSLQANVSPYQSGVARSKAQCFIHTTDGSYPRGQVSLQVPELQLGEVLRGVMCSNPSLRSPRVPSPWIILDGSCDLFLQAETDKQPIGQTGTCKDFYTHAEFAVSITCINSGNCHWVTSLYHVVYNSHVIFSSLHFQYHKHISLFPVQLIQWLPIVVSYLCSLTCYRSLSTVCTATSQDFILWSQVISRISTGRISTLSRSQELSSQQSQLIRTTR